MMITIVRATATTEVTHHTLASLSLQVTRQVPIELVEAPGLPDMSSWEFFDYLLANACVVGTPGAGFGKNGEGWFRLTAFGDRDRTIEAMQRLEKLIGSAS